LFINHISSLLNKTLGLLYSVSESAAQYVHNAACADAEGCAATAEGDTEEHDEDDAQGFPDVEVMPQQSHVRIHCGGVSVQLLHLLRQISHALIDVFL
jgi:hypothetical protein